MMSSCSRVVPRILLVGACMMGVDAHARDMPDPVTLMEWDGIRITNVEFEAELRRIPEEQRFSFRQDGKRIEDMLNTLVVHKTFAERARQAGYLNDPVNVAELRIAEDRALSSLWLADYRSKLALPDFEQLAIEYYKTNSKLFQTPESVWVSHVLLNPKKRGGVEATKKLAQEVRQKLLDGADFTAMVKEYSDDPSAVNNGGDMGYFSRGKMVKQFEEVAFAMQKKGELSDLVETKFGFHIIKFHDRRPEGTRPYEEVAANLKDSLKKKYITDRVSELLGSTRNQPNMKRNESAIESLRTPPLLTQTVK